jgi:hypothetical protein
MLRNKQKFFRIDTATLIYKHIVKKADPVILTKGERDDYIR